jgi:Flp pilus assembly protein TadG
MRRKKGQAVVEIALVLPILLFVLCGIVDFGRILYASSHLNIVSQEAVRLGGIGSKDYEIAEFVNNKVHLADKDSMIVKITPTDLQRKSGDYITVNISYQVKYITPLMNTILPSPFNVITGSTIRVE